MYAVLQRCEQASLLLVATVTSGHGYSWLFGTYGLFVVHIESHPSVLAIVCPHSLLLCIFWLGDCVSPMPPLS